MCITRAHWPKKESSQRTENGDGDGGGDDDADPFVVIRICSNKQCPACECVCVFHWLSHSHCSICSCELFTRFQVIYVCWHVCIVCLYYHEYFASLTAHNSAHPSPLHAIHFPLDLCRSTTEVKCKVYKARGFQLVWIWNVPWRLNFMRAIHSARRVCASFDIILLVLLIYVWDRLNLLL